MVSISGTSCRTGLLLILVLCITRVVLGEVIGEEVNTLKRIRGVVKLHASGGAHELLEVADQEVGPTRRNVEGASDQASDKRFHYSEAKLVTEKVRSVSLKAETTAAAANVPIKEPPKNSTTGTPPPSVSPPPAVSPPKSIAAQQSPPPKDEIVSPPPVDPKSPPVHRGTCDSGPVIGNLKASGGDGEDGYTLTVENAGAKRELDVTIKTSSGWKAKPSALALVKGQNMNVTISIIDNEAAKLGARIDISWSEGDCHVNIPAQNVADNMVHSSYMDYLTAPGTAAMVLGGSLVVALILGIAGVWGCVSWRARARRHGEVETKYRELEMTLPTTVTKQDDDISPSADGWDEVWEDDDWQDTEATRASSTSLTLSSQGLNSRRANKDGWDSSWDD